MKLPSLLACLLFSAAACAQQPVKPASDLLQPLDFLLGTWSAKADATGGSAGASALGTYTFRRDLDGHAIVRSSSSDKCSGPSAFDCAHHDMLTVFADPNGAAVHNATIFALYLDNEGHTIYYTVVTPDAHTAIFNSQSPPKTPHFRLTYHLEGDGPKAVMTGRFEMAAPGSDQYTPYLSWSGTKQ